MEYFQSNRYIGLRVEEPLLRALGIQKGIQVSSFDLVGLVQDTVRCYYTPMLYQIGVEGPGQALVVFNHTPVAREFIRANNLMAIPPEAYPDAPVQHFPQRINPDVNPEDISDVTLVSAAEVAAVSDRIISQQRAHLQAQAREPPAVATTQVAPLALSLPEPWHNLPGTIAVGAHSPPRSTPSPVLE